MRSTGAGLSTYHLVEITPDSAKLTASDKYTTFTPHARGYRQSVHKTPKWTKVSLHPLDQAVGRLS